jgi:hypothetical protein
VVQAVRTSGYRAVPGVWPTCKNVVERDAALPWGLDGGGLGTESTV